jgi:hypothetical protein
MNKEQQELLDEVYENFEKWYNEHSGKEDYTGYYVPNKEEFIRLIKTDNEFSEKWGLKIEERELSLEERVKIWDEKYLKDVLPENSMDNLDLNGDNIPTKLITITYNNKIIEMFLP